MQYKQKYEWLLSKLAITEVDIWEKDAMMEMPRHTYFQFGVTIPHNMDAVVEAAMKEEGL